MSRSSHSSTKNERRMYRRFSDALNYGLERLSKIEVDGLPKFRNNIVFVPWGVEGSSFEPDVVLMSLATACDLHGITDRESLGVSQFVTKVTKTSSEAIPSKNAPPRRRVGWKYILSAVEVKRSQGQEETWPVMGNFTDEVPSFTNKGLDEQLLQSPSSDSETSSDISDISTSQSQTRKVHALVYKQTTEELYSGNFKIRQDQEADRE